MLDTAPEERFDRLTRLAQDMFQTPIALVSLVDERPPVVQVQPRARRQRDAAGRRLLRPRDPRRRGARRPRCHGRPAVRRQPPRHRRPGHPLLRRRALRPRTAMPSGPCASSTPSPATGPRGVAGPARPGQRRRGGAQPDPPPGPAAGPARAHRRHGAHRARPEGAAAPCPGDRHASTSACRSASSAGSTVTTTRSWSRCPRPESCRTVSTSPSRARTASWPCDGRCPRHRPHGHSEYSGHPCYEVFGLESLHRRPARASTASGRHAQLLVPGAARSSIVQRRRYRLRAHHGAMGGGDPAALAAQRATAVPAAHRRGDHARAVVVHPDRRPHRRLRRSAARHPELTGCAYGFVGEVLHRPNGAPTSRPTP